MHLQLAGLMFCPLRQSEPLVSLCKSQNFPTLYASSRNLSSINMDTRNSRANAATSEACEFTVSFGKIRN